MNPTEDGAELTITAILHAIHGWRDAYDNLLDKKGSDLACDEAEAGHQQCVGCALVCESLVLLKILAVK